MLLTIKQTITPGKREGIILGNLSYSAYKLWNVANYEKKNYKELGLTSFPNWYEQKKRLKGNFFYKNLPSQTAQEVLNVLQQSWKSFFIPRQLKSYLKDAHFIDDNYFFLKIKRFSDINNVKQIEFIPLKDGKYEVVLIYEVADKRKLTSNGNYLSVDIGVKNLMTCYDNRGSSFIISGNRYLNTCYYYNKQIAYYQSISDAQQSAKGVQYPKKSRKVLSLYKKRANCINDIVHKATRYIADYCKENDINAVVIGDIRNIRIDNNLGKQTNQVFHALPFKKIYDKLQYKLDMYGIALIKQKESYSSQCSPDSKDVSKTNAKKSNRKYRGLYKEGDTIYNADCVGAYNILRLYKQSAMMEVIHPLYGLSNPVKVSV